MITVYSFRDSLRIMVYLAAAGYMEGKDFYYPVPRTDLSDNPTRRETYDINFSNKEAEAYALKRFGKQAK